ncbi:hypothetical protein P9112_007242 [Eukaryota sp. TZLM1-RC]
MQDPVESSPIKRLNPAQNSVGDDFIQNLNGDLSLSEASLELPRESKLSGELAREAVLKDGTDMGSPIKPNLQKGPTSKTPNHNPKPKRRLLLSQDSTINNSTFGSSDNLSSLPSISASIADFSKARISQDSQPLSQYNLLAVEQPQTNPNPNSNFDAKEGLNEAQVLIEEEERGEEKTMQEANDFDVSRLEKLKELQAKKPDLVSVSPRKRVHSALRGHKEAQKGINLQNESQAFEEVSLQKDVEPEVASQEDLCGNPQQLDPQEQVVSQAQNPHYSTENSRIAQNGGQKDAETERLELVSELNKLKQTEELLRLTIDRMNYNFEQERERFDAQINSLKTENSKLLQNISEFKTTKTNRYESLNKEIHTLSSKLDVAQKRAVDAEKQVKINSEQHKLEKHELNKMIESLRNALKSLENSDPAAVSHPVPQNYSVKRIRELETKLAAANSQIVMLKKKLSEKEKPIRRPATQPAPSTSKPRDTSRPNQSKINQSKSIAPSKINQECQVYGLDELQVSDDSETVRRLRQDLDELHSAYHSVNERSKRRIQSLEQALGERETEVSGLNSKISLLNTQIKTLTEQIGGQTAETTRDLRLCEMRYDERVNQVKEHYCEEIKRLREHHAKTLTEMENSAEVVQLEVKNELSLLRKKLNEAQIARARSEQRVFELQSELDVLKVNPVVGSVMSFLDKLEHLEKSIGQNQQEDQSKIDSLLVENQRLSNLVVQKNNALKDLKSQISAFMKKNG